MWTDVPSCSGVSGCVAPVRCIITHTHTECITQSHHLCFLLNEQSHTAFTRCPVSSSTSGRSCSQKPALNTHCRSRTHAQVWRWISKHTRQKSNSCTGVTMHNSFCLNMSNDSFCGPKNEYRILIWQKCLSTVPINPLWPLCDSKLDWLSSLSSL